MSINVGIDLGTTFSVVCHKDKKQTFIKDESGKILVPSVVCYGGDGYVGLEAVENEENHPELTIRSSKRFIGSPEPLLGESEFGVITATDVAKDILFYLRSLTEAQYGENVDGIVITVPAYFNQNQRLETKKAAEEAGFNVLRIINEPTAAALAYGDDAVENELVLVYDLGGGTFDVTLLQMTDDNIYHVLSTSGDTRLGGDDFDNLIAAEFMKILPDNFKPFSDFHVRLHKFSEEIKIQLNFKDSIKKTLKYCGTINGKLHHQEFTITAEKYYEMILPLLLKTKSHVLTALHDANKKISSLSKIILVGGSTKSKFVRRYVEKEFLTKVYYEIDPDLTVAAGAANLAKSITDQSKDGALLIDVTPLSLGIETKGGLLNKIIPRNTNIPVCAAEEFITAEDNQDVVNIRIYQGERPLAKDNEFLGEFVLSGFEKRPKGQTRIVVKFDIDSSGLITVTAFDKISGLQSNVTLNPLTSDRVNSVLDDMEGSFSDDEKIKTQIELEQLTQEAKTLILSKSLADYNVEEYNETLQAVKNNLPALRVFLQSLKDDF